MNDLYAVRRPSASAKPDPIETSVDDSDAVQRLHLVHRRELRRMTVVGVNWELGPEPTSRTLPQWRKFRATCLAEGRDPEDYLRRLFFTLRRSVPGRTSVPLQPSWLLSTSNRQAHDELLRVLPAILAMEWRSQQNVAAVRIGVALRAGSRDPAVVVAEVASDLRVEMSPLVRLCLVHGLRDDCRRALLRSLMPLAAENYLLDPTTYDELCGTWLPPRFAERAPKAYSRLLSR